MTSNKLKQNVVVLRSNLEEKVFIGQYTERRLIDSLKTYKDVIEVSSKDYEFNETLKKIKSKLSDSSEFFSIVECENGYELLTDLWGCALGSYWFMIKSFDITNNYVKINIKCLRPYTEENRSSIPNFSDFKNFDWNIFLVTFFDIVNKNNIKNFLRFISIVFIAMLVGIYKLLELLLLFLKEFNNVVKILTPIVIAFIDAATKAFGGLLIMINMMWKTRSSKFQGQNIPISRRNPYLEYNYDNARKNYTKRIYSNRKRS